MAIHPRNNRTPSGAKKRWSPEDRARRDEQQTRGKAPSAREQRRAERFGPAPTAEGRPARGGYRGRDERPAREPYRARSERFRSDEQGEERGDGRQDRRVDWYPGPRTKPAARGGRPADRDSRPDRFDRRPSEPRSHDRGPRIDRAAAPERRPRTEGRPFRGNDSRPERRFEPRAERPERRFEERPPRRFEERSDRPERRFDERSERRFDERTEREPRRYDERPERPERRFDERPPRHFEERERPARRFEDRERPQRQFEDRERPQRRFEAPRSLGRDAASRRPGTGDRGPRPQRHDEPSARYSAPEDVVLEKLEGEVVQADDVVEVSFGDLGLGDSITGALAELGAVHPFPIQAVTIPDAVDGKHVLGRGRTGSGKTIAFGAAMVERLLRSWQEAGGGRREPGRPPRALILAPTRELALQIDRTVQPLARSVRLYTTQLVGGVPYPRQIGALRKGVDIVIGTPGRVEDLVEQGVLDLASIEITVLDEADHMAELGFLEPMQRLLRAVPADGQRLLFSATLDSAVTTLVDEFLPGAAVHEVVDKDGSTAEHRVLVIEPSEKIAALAALLGSVDRALVFARTRAFAEQLADDLDDAGVRAESLHGDLNQSRRTRNLGRFSEGKVKALVATDVAARGIHVDDVELVVHADAAEDYKTYLHRSGRTGRAGASGTVVTLLTPRRRRRFEELLDRAGIEADFVRLQPGADPVAALAR